MTTGPLGHDELHEQAGLYVLGGLSPPERAAFEAHLATCAACKADVLEWSAVSGALAQSVPQVDPPEALRARVLAAVAAIGDDRTAKLPPPFPRKPAPGLVQAPV